MKRLKWGDLMIVLTVVAVSVLFFLLYRPEGAATYATVSVDGQTVRRISLPSNERIELDNGVVILFDGMRACIEQSDCPDKTCMKKGWISTEGMSSVCLPNRTVLSLDGDDVIVGG